MKDLNYHVVLKGELGHNIEGDFLSKEKPEWFKKHPTLVDGTIKSRTDFLRKNWNDIMNGLYTPRALANIKTSRTCPAFNTLFKHSVAIKFPCDVMIETSDKGEYNFQYKNRFTTLKTISHHAAEQMGGDLDNYIALKFEFDCTINVKDTFVQFVDPIFWNDQPYLVSPGLVPATHLPLNIIVFFPKINERYVLDCGTVCAVLSFSNPIRKLVEKDMSKSIMKRFWEIDKQFFKLGKYNDD